MHFSYQLIRDNEMTTLADPPVPFPPNRSNATFKRNRAATSGGAIALGAGTLERYLSICGDISIGLFSRLSYFPDRLRCIRYSRTWASWQHHR